jgi:hypothetical protein
MEESKNILNEDKINLIKSTYISSNLDSFTNIKTIKCLKPLVWNGSELFKMLSTKLSSDKMIADLVYVHQNDSDLLGINFLYTSLGNGYPDLNNLKMFLKFDDLEVLEYTNTGNHHSNFKAGGAGAVNTYYESVTLFLEISDLIKIVNAKKVEFSIRIGLGKIEGQFSNYALFIFKGFYNSIFDNSFEFDSIYNFIVTNQTILNKQQKSTGCLGFFLATIVISVLLSLLL